MNSPPAKSKQSNGAPPSLLVLLDELISEILSRLPVKTLMQIKCVCKSWKTLISDPAFAKLHLQRSPKNTHFLLIPEWSMPDEDWDCSVVPFTVTDLIESPLLIIGNYRLRCITISYDHRSHYRLRNMDCWKIVGSCNGLLCLIGGSDPLAIENQTWFRFWNPATRTLSEKLGYLSLANSYRFTFGYDVSTDSYKVLAFSTNKVKVFSLSDNVWKNIECFPSVPFGLHPSSLRYPFVNNGVYISGTINWLTIRNKTEYEWNDITIEQFVIVSLDLATETYQELLPPRGFVEVPPVEPSVNVLMDCLCFSHRAKGTHFVIWKMMEFGVRESWTLFLRISFQSLRIYHGIDDWLAYGSQLFLFPLYFCDSSDTLIIASNQGGDGFYNQHAIVYNWRNNIVEEITSNHNDILWFYTKGYIESLVSTCPKTTPSTSSTYGIVDG
ncbi:F-box/kelch-repeat protein At3g23880-like [Vicia villosa]|uniref:F-box/kelch-repeat protein At3g23880-like n=1 Tax=Vicia villosa TaxID=3911 RepID=UPI00273B61F4|nr:F-box/kelch-repeat protein At3g23880-like [Vicia villosa]